MQQYELRFRKNDGRIALQFVTAAPDDHTAREIADAYWTPQHATLEIYRDQQRIRELRNPHAVRHHGPFKFGLS